MTRDPILVDFDKRVMVVPHLGVTLRVMLGAALAQWPDPQPNDRCELTLVYKDTAIGTLRVRQYTEPHSGLPLGDTHGPLQHPQLDGAHAPHDE